jgi:hypothetical protein
MPPIGREFVHIERPSLTYDQKKQIKEANYKVFIEMHRLLPFQEKSKWLGPLLAKDIKSSSARYKEKSLEPYERMTTWVARVRGEKEVGLYTQVVEDVGGKWKPKDHDEPLLRAVAIDGGVKYCTNQDLPFDFDEQYTFDWQMTAADNLLQTLAEIGNSSSVGALPHRTDSQQKRILE